MSDQDLSTGELAMMACLLEARAPKAGNVSPAKGFEGTTLRHFIEAAAAISGPLDRAAERSLGDTVLEAVTESRKVTEQNVNLGIILLLGPLASAPAGGDLRDGVREVLDKLDEEDCRKVYEAIRIAAPGGLGSVETADVNEPPPGDLIAAMELAAERDLVARQYVNGFEQVFCEGLDWLREACEAGLELDSAIVRLHLQFMASYPDSLIARKCGPETARKAAAGAARVLEGGWPEAGTEALFTELDSWLREDGNRRNPGTSADLVAGCLFLALRAGIIALPPAGPASGEPPA
ncbi:MAG: triphosphoribosyl-dephospho-CoA synthase [Planctomycetota bacterium]|nr:triphosphoribosyl-dephospho-CoA synthase [Planctomycetota bacterium]